MAKASNPSHKTKREIIKEIEGLLGQGYTMPSSFYHDCSMFALIGLKNAIINRIGFRGKTK